MIRNILGNSKAIMTRWDVHLLTHRRRVQPLNSHSTFTLSSLKSESKKNTGKEMYKKMMNESILLLMT